MSQIKHVTKFKTAAFFISLLLLLSLQPSLLAQADKKSGNTDFSWQNFPWQSSLSRDHSLNGKIWSLKEQKYISPKLLTKRLADVLFIGLGETHDNPDHHLLQAWLIDQVSQSTKRKPAIVMEMIDAGQKQALNTFLSKNPSNAQALGVALKWDKSGWPDWSIYQPIAQIALDNKLSLVAGNPTKKTGKMVGRKGYDSLGDTLKKELNLDKPLPGILEKDLSAQIVSGHCNMIPPSATAPMMRVQRLRDAVMARNMLKASAAKGQASDGAILIAGSGHIRKDRGVPWYIRKAGKNMVSVLMAESSPDSTNPLDFLSQAPKGYLIADYIWITPKTERPDPCEQFKKFMKRKHHKK